jgi:DNA polymerase-3 subunit delta'
VAIVDDAERLSAEAQNAFLKTLEEPPPGTTLVLVADVAEKLLPTVRSRCALHRFGRLSDADMDAFVALDPARRGAVPASLSSGSPGLLRTLAEEPVASARRTVLDLAADPRVASPFGFAARLLADCGASDDEEDPDARERTRDRLALALRLLSFALRDLLVLALGLEGVALRHEDERARLAAAAAGRDPDALSDGIDLCDDAIAALRRNADAALTLESLAARMKAAESLQFRAAS